jgi:hypothetical protein
MYRISKSCFVVLAVTFLVFSNTSSAFGQSPFEPGGVSITPTIGFAIIPDGDVSLTTSGAVGYPIGPKFVVEGELGYLFDLAPDNANIDSSLTTVHGSLLYLFNSQYLVKPYLAAGLGIGRFSVEADGPPSASLDSTEIGVNLGGGVFYPLKDDALWLRGDVRYFNHIDDVPAAWRFSAGLVLRVGGQ